MPVLQPQDFDPAQRTPEVIVRSETHGRLLAMALMTWARTDGGHDVLGARRQRLMRTTWRPAARRLVFTPPRFARPLLPHWAPTAPSSPRWSAAASRPAALRRAARLRPSIARPPRCCAGHAPERGRAPHRAVPGRRSGQDAHACRPLELDPHRPVKERRADRQRRAAVRAAGIAMSDAFVATRKIKFELNLLAARHLHPAHARCELGAADDGDAALPRIPSGHSVQSGAAAEVLERFYGRDTAFEDRFHNDRGWGRSASRASRPPRSRPPCRASTPASTSARRSNTAARSAAASARRHWRCRRAEPGAPCRMLGRCSHPIRRRPVARAGGLRFTATAAAARRAGADLRRAARPAGTTSARPQAVRRPPTKAASPRW